MIGISAEKQHSTSTCCGNISWVSFWKFSFSLPFYIILIQVIFSEQNKLVLLAGEYKQIFVGYKMTFWQSQPSWNRMGSCLLRSCACFFCRWSHSSLVYMPIYHGNQQDILASNKKLGWAVFKTNSGMQCKLMPIKPSHCYNYLTSGIKKDYYNQEFK